MIDEFLLGVGEHFLVVVALFGEYPLQVRNLLGGFGLAPDLAGKQELADEVLVVVGFGDYEV